MNPLYDELFNPNVIAQTNMQQLYYQQHAYEQNKEMENAVKALHDYFNAVRNITPDFQQQAFYLCAATVIEEINKQKKL